MKIFEEMSHVTSNIWYGVDPDHARYGYRNFKRNFALRYLFIM